MANRSVEEWRKDSQSFDAVADEYNKYRPEYPPEMAESIISMSNIPTGGQILEVGSGTGKATQLFARFGYTIHCIEPGSNLAALAARGLKGFPQVSFEISRFEEWPELPAGFDLVISGQAFHWVTKEIGFPKVARVLKPGGSLALFWNMHSGAPEPIDAQLDRIYQEIAPEMDSPPISIEETIIERCEAIELSGCFGPVTLKRFPWSISYQTEAYLGLISTYSDHIRLPSPVRQRLFERIAEAIDAQGGSIRRDYVAVLHFAQKPS